MQAFLGFSAEIHGVEYPAVAIFKLDHGACFCWNGDHPIQGHLAIFDLVPNRQHFISGSWEVHGSRHRDGSRHQALEPKGHRKIYVAPSQDVAARKLASDSSIRTVTVPLLQPFDWWSLKQDLGLNNPLWNVVKARHVLKREAFGDNVDGVFLHGYMCRRERVDDLLARWRQETHTSWVEHDDDDFDLVVMAEVVKNPHV